MAEPNPCITCGACCTRYRVSFHWMETTLECAPAGSNGALTGHDFTGHDLSSLDHSSATDAGGPDVAVDEAFEDLPPAVPVDLTESLGPHRNIMKGTGTIPARCIALTGEVGVSAHCSIHRVRPSPCREFERSWENGRAHDRCDASRRAYGLPPLPRPFEVPPPPVDWTVSVDPVDPVNSADSDFVSLSDDQELLTPFVVATGHPDEVGTSRNPAAEVIPPIPDDAPIAGGFPS